MVKFGRDPVQDTFGFGTGFPSAFTVVLFIGHTGNKRNRCAVGDGRCTVSVSDYFLFNTVLFTF